MELSYGDSDEFTIESNAGMRVFYRQHQSRREGMRITVTLYEVAEVDETLIKLIEQINEPEPSEPDRSAEEVLQAPQKDAQYIEWSLPSEMPRIPEMMPNFDSLPQPSQLTEVSMDIPSLDQPQVQEVDDDNEVDFNNMMILQPEARHNTGTFYVDTDKAREMFGGGRASIPVTAAPSEMELQRK